MHLHRYSPRRQPIAERNIPSTNDLHQQELVTFAICTSQKLSANVLLIRICILTCRLKQLCILCTPTPSMGFRPCAPLPPAVYSTVQDEATFFHRLQNIKSNPRSFLYPIRHVACSCPPVENIYRSGDRMHSKTQQPQSCKTPNHSMTCPSPSRCLTGLMQVCFIFFAVSLHLS